MIGWLNDINRLVSKDKREPRVIPAENTHTHASARSLTPLKTLAARRGRSHQLPRRSAPPQAAPRGGKKNLVASFAVAPCLVPQAQLVFGFTKLLWGRCRTGFSAGVRIKVESVFLRQLATLNRWQPAEDASAESAFHTLS